MADPVTDNVNKGWIWPFGPVRTVKQGNISVFLAFSFF